MESGITKSLRKEGLNVKIGHKKAYIGPQTGLVIYNRAIPKDNPELIEARRRKIPVIPYARVLGEITKGHTTIAITGSHGKTTTTALAGLMLLKNNFDPTIFIGSNLRELGGKNIRIGKSSYLVLEADDFGAAFLEYTPKIAIVTNIDREHLDFYKTFGNLKKSFLHFLSNTERGGAMILNRDDENLAGLRSKIAVIAKQRDVAAIWYSRRDAAAKRIKASLRIPGEHNVSNALAAYTLGHFLKIPEKKILASLASYRGAWRRMEYRGAFPLLGTKRKLPVFDDYAHHPTEIRATLQAFREKFPRSPLVCVFEPHQAKRLELLFNEFRAAFTGADATILLPIYKVRGRNEHARYDSRSLADAMRRKYPKEKIWHLANVKKLRSFLGAIVGEHFRGHVPVVIMMGAGSIVNLTDTLVS